MKKLNIIFLFISGAIIISCSSSKGDSKSPQITITTEMEIGTPIEFSINEGGYDASEIWVDLNNNKVRDEGESFNPEDRGKFKGILGSQTFTVNGNIDGISLTILEITDLDLTKCPNLREIYLSSNKLTTLDLTKNPELKRLDLTNNQVTELDLRHNPNLKIVWIDSNKIKNLKAKKFEQLNEIYCQDNEISAASMIELFKAVPDFKDARSAEAIVSYGEDWDLNEVPQEAVDIAKSKNWRVVKSTKQGDIEY